MNKQEKELAVKVFDYFFKKAKISEVEIVPTKSMKCEIDLRLHLHKAWCISYLVGYRNNCRFQIDDRYSNSFIKRYSANALPDDIKRAIISRCIESNSALLVFPSAQGGNRMNVIPAAGSLEELAIHMELES